MRHIKHGGRRCGRRTNTTCETMKHRRSLFRQSPGRLGALPELVRRALRAGTSSYPAAERDGLVINNIIGYLASLSSLSYAVNYALMDAVALAPLVLGNVLSAGLTATVPLVHRYGRLAGAVLLTTTLYTSIFYFTYLLGRGSGIQLNYIGAAAIGFLVLGLARVRLVVLVVVVAAILHVAAWFMFPEPGPGIHVSSSFINQTYAMSATSIMAIIFVAVYYAFTLVRDAQARSEALLLNILPEAIAERLKASPDQTIAERHEDATVLFADLVGFTALSTRVGPERVVELMDDLFTAFDAIVARLGVEKIKTIGDAYMVVAGAPLARADHAEAIAELAFEMQTATADVCARQGFDLQIRVGLASGPIMAGVIGRTKFAYDVWGETVNLAARLESNGAPGVVLACGRAKSTLEKRYRFSHYGAINLKGIGQTDAWQLIAGNDKE